MKAPNSCASWFLPLSTEFQSQPHKSLRYTKEGSALSLWVWPYLKNMRQDPLFPILFFLLSLSAISCVVSPDIVCCFPADLSTCCQKRGRKKTKNKKKTNPNCFTETRCAWILARTRQKSNVIIAIVTAQCFLGIGMKCNLILIH